MVKIGYRRKRRERTMITTETVYRHRCSCCGHVWETYGWNSNPKKCPACCRVDWDWDWKPCSPCDNYKYDKPFDIIFDKKIKIF